MFTQTIPNALEESQKASQMVNETQRQLINEQEVLIHRINYDINSTTNSAKQLIAVMDFSLDG